MKASELIKQLIILSDKYGDLEIAVETVLGVYELTDKIDWDTFEPGHPGFFILEESTEL